MNRYHFSLLNFLLFLSLLLSFPLSADTNKPDSNTYTSVSALKQLEITADMNHPSVLRRFDSNYSILDGANNQLLIFGSNGKKKSRFPQYTANKRIGVLLNPMDFQPYRNKLYVADTGKHRIVILNKKGTYLEEIPLGSLDTQLMDKDESDQLPVKRPEPVGLLLSDEKLTYSDRANHRLCSINLEQANRQRCWGTRGEAEGELQFPFMLAEDSDRYIYVVDVLNSRVQIFNSRGMFYGALGGFGSQPGELVRPNGIAIDQKGLVYVSDYYQGRVSLYENRQFKDYLRDDDGEILQLDSPVGLSIQGENLSVVEAGENKASLFLISYTTRLSRTHDGDEPKALQLSSNSPIKKIGKKKNCATCHLSWEQGGNSTTNSDAIEHREAVLPVVEPKMCLSCHHGAVVETREVITQKHQHPDIHHPTDPPTKADKQADKIDDVFPLIKDDKLYCGSCHTPHEDHQSLYENRISPWMRSPNQQGQVCTGCHASKTFDVKRHNTIAQGKNHPIGFIFSKPPTKMPQHFSQNKELWSGLPEMLAKVGGTARHNHKQQEELICQSCHRVHGAESEPLLLMDNKSGQLCDTCHVRQTASSIEEAKSKGVHPVNISLDEAVEFSGEKIDRIECLTCHSVHEGKKGTANLVLNDKDGELCKGCHEEKNKVLGSDHDLRISAKGSHNQHGHSPEEAGSCGSCHSMHQGNGEKLFLFSASTPEQAEVKDDNQKSALTERDRLCIDCHQEKGIAEKKIVSLYDHPFQEIVMRSRNKKFPLVNSKGELAEQGQIACVTCHNPHQWAPETEKNIKTEGSQEKENKEGNAFNSFLTTTQPNDLFCKDCHGAETRLRYKYYHHELSRQFDLPIK